MPSVFLSYSRADRDFVIQVRDALARAKREVWVDLEDIPPSAEWQREINAGIETSDAFVCVLSPEWAASEVCQIELNNAVAEHKRVIPLLHRDVPHERLAPTVRALNWIPFRETDNLNAAFEQLIFALDTDLDYWHLASRLLVRAGEWEHNQANASFLLRGKELAEAEQWLAEGAEKQPSPTALQMRYITASRRGAVRRQRALIGGLSVFLAIAVTLAALASIQTVRVSQSNDQLRISNNRLFARALAGASSAALVNDHVDQALLLSVAATEQQDTEQTRNALLDALEFTPHLATTVANPFQMGATSGAAAVGYSADGKTLMYAFEGDQGRIGLWDTATQRVRAQYSVGDTVYKAALSPDGTRLATLGLDHGLVLREADSGHPVATLAPTETLDPNNQQPITQNIALGGVGVAFSPRGDKLAAILCDTATCAHPYIGLWDGHTGVAAGRLALRFQPLLTTFAFSPDGSRLAATECDVFSGSGPCELAAWNLAAGNAHLYRHAISAVDGAPFGVQAAAFTADGKTLYTAGCASPACDERGRLIAWDPATGARVAGSPPLISPSGAIAKLAFSPDGHTFVTADATKNLYLWDLGSRAPIGGPIAGHESEVQSVAFAPDGTEFATGSDDGKVLLWRLRPYSPFSLPPGRDFDGTSQAAFSPDGRLLATANCDGAVRLWDAQSAHVTKRLSVEGASGFCLRTLAFSPDGRQLAAEAYNGVTPIWDVASGNLTSFCNCGDIRGGLQETAQGLAFAPDGRLLAVATQSDAGGEVVLAEVGSGARVRTFTSPGGYSAPGIAFSPDGSLLALGLGGTNDDGITLFDLHKQAVVGMLEGHQAEVGALAFVAHGRELVSLDANGVLKTWDVAGRRAIGSLILGKNIMNEPSISVHHDGWLLAASASQSIWLVDLHDPASPTLYVHPLEEHTYVHNVAFSPDGRLLAVGESDGVLVRYASERAWQQQACGIANRELTQAEWDQLLGDQQRPIRPVCANLPAAS